MLVSLVLVWALKTKQLTKQCINKGYMCLFSTFIIFLQKLRMPYILGWKEYAVRRYHVLNFWYISFTL